MPADSSGSPRKLERNPLALQNNSIGPAAYLHEITHTGGLPAHREQKGIKFRQDPELPEGITKRSLPVVDQGTLKQGVFINPVSSSQQYPTGPVSAMGKQVLSTRISAGTIPMSSPTAPLERNPFPEPMSNIGPAQFFNEMTHTGGLPAHREQKGIKFRQDPELPEGISRRSLPIVDNGTLKQGCPISEVSYAAQYPVKASSSMGKQLLSHSVSAGTITMTSPKRLLERNPFPEPMSDIGPAQFCHELTYVGGLPAHREQKGIKFRQDPELPEGISRRSLPIVDNGTLKQGQAISVVDPYSQYPVTSTSSSLGRQIKSQYRSAGGVTMSRNTSVMERSATTQSADTNGPAQFNMSRTIDGKRTLGTSNLQTRTISRAAAERKGADLFNISKPKDDSISQWLDKRGENVKIKVTKGVGRLPSKMDWTWDGQPRMKSDAKIAREANMKGGKGEGGGDDDDDAGGGGKKSKKKTVKKMESIADWLANNGLPSADNIFKAEFERRQGTKGKGHVQPTFLSVRPKYSY
jgi:hypothetical protein